VRTRAASVILACSVSALLALAVFGAALRGPWVNEPRTFDFGFPAPSLPIVEQPQQEGDPNVIPERPEPLELDLSWLAVLLLVLAVVLISALLWWLVRRYRRPIGAAEAPRGEVAEVPESPAPDLPVLLRGVHAARTSLARFAAPADAVVAAWLSLEEAAERSGVHRSPSATPTEFTMAVLAATPAPPHATRELLELYRTARFSTHPVTAADVERASRCLGEIAESFERVHAPQESPA
jgi:hypothetical protein